MLINKPFFTSIETNIKEYLLHIFELGKNLNNNEFRYYSTTLAAGFSSLASSLNSIDRVCTVCDQSLRLR
jgi:hypothetical protein